MINFCFDKINGDDFSPNLAADCEVDQCAVTYPFSDYPRLLEYLDQEQIEYGLYSTLDAPKDSFYFINVNYFDHSIDWYDLMPVHTFNAIKNKKYKLIFFDCEPEIVDIKHTLQQLVEKHNVDHPQFICHSTLASKLPNFHYFNDDELLYRSAQNYSKHQSIWHNNHRSKKFTFLVRRHKNWRLSVAADFWSSQLHNDSYFSYNGIDAGHGGPEDATIYDINLDNNPLQLDNIDAMADFTNQMPFNCDAQSDELHDDYENHIDKFYSDAYWNIVLETYVNLEGTIGSFITEKTFKPIRHNQAFIIIGTIGSLSHLRELGYKTFDGIIDESYDYIKNDLQRYHAVRNVIHDLAAKSSNEFQEINQQVKPIVEHNSALFNASKKHRLEKLINNLLSDP